MNSRQFASLSCKIIGIFLFIHGITLLSNLLYAMFTWTNQDGSLNAWNISVGLTVTLFAILLYCFSNKLATIMLKTEKHHSEDLKITVYDIERVAFSVIGLFLIGSSLPKSITTIAYFFSYQGDKSTIFLQTGDSLIQLIVGIVIFVCSNKIADFSNRKSNKDINVD